MNTFGTIIYKSKCSGLTFNGYQFSENYPHIDSILISADNNFIQIDVKFSGLHDETNVRKHIDPVANEILLSICKIFMLKNENFSIEALSIPNKNSDITLTVHNCSQAHSSTNIQLNESPTTEDLNEIEKLVKNNLGKNNINSNLFRNALMYDDCVTKYILLYTIALLLNKNSKNEESQRQVDACIKKYQPNVEMFNFPVKRDAEETIYTKLRNEISHVRNYTTYKETTENIKTYLPKFTEIVRDMIYDNS